MSRDEPEVRPGARIRLSVLGRERCPRFKIDTGVIVSRIGPSAVRIRFDGHKHPLTLHLSYIELPIRPLT